MNWVYHVERRDPRHAGSDVPFVRVGHQRGSDAAQAAAVLLRAARWHVRIVGEFVPSA